MSDDWQRRWREAPDASEIREQQQENRDEFQQQQEREMEQQQISGTELITLPPAERAALALASGNTEKHLRELVAYSNGIVTVEDAAGRDEAHRSAMALRGARTTISKTGKAAREDATAFSQAVISEEKRLISLIQPEEDRVLDLRDRWDAKLAAEKAERDRKEAERKAGLQSKVDAIRNLPLGLDGETAAEIATEIEALRQFVPDGAEFFEFADAAKDAANGAIVAMMALHDRQVSKEAESAALEAQRIENARIAAEQEAERQRLAAVAADQAAALKAEQDKFAAEQKAAADRAAAEQAERDRVSAETKRQLEAQQAAIAADRKAIEDERAKLAAEREAAELAKVNPGQVAADQMRDIFNLGPSVGIDTPEQAAEKNAAACAMLEAVAAAPSVDQTVVGLPSTGPIVIDSFSVGGETFDMTPPVVVNSPPTLRLGQISERLGFVVTADFLLSLGFAHSATEKAAKLYYEHEFPHICRALMRHIESKIAA